MHECISPALAAFASFAKQLIPGYTLWAFAGL